MVESNVMKKLVICLVFLVFLFGCFDKKADSDGALDVESDNKEQQETTQVNEVEETIFKNFSDGDFSIAYPDWPEDEYSNHSILGRRNGPCFVHIDRHNASIDPLFNWIVNLTMANENVTLEDVDLENHMITITAPHQNITFRATFVMTYCNYQTYVIGATCVEGYWEDEKENIDMFLSGGSCAKIYEEPDYSTAYNPPNLENTTYSTFVDEDYSVDMPDWEMGKAGEDTVFAYTRLACSVVLNKYSTPSENLYGWIEQHVDNNESIKLVHKHVPNQEIIYDTPYGDLTVRTRSKTVYCNYQSYNIITMCEKGYYEENKEVLEHIVDSSKCAKEYVFSPEITTIEAKEIEVEESDSEETTEQPEQTPGVVETDVGEEYGINAEGVVIFFNSNPLFKKVMRYYDRVNLHIVGDNGEDIRLKAILEDGVITNVKEGFYEDADFTFIIPLDDALNIFNNADNITFKNFLSFIKNVKTEPSNMLRELIANAFKPDKG